MTEPLATQRVREARARYFAENGFGNGGYDDRFVVLRVGGVPVLALPNTRQRVRSVRILDRTVGELRRELGLDASG